MSKEKSNKKVNKLTLKECEVIIQNTGGQVHCLYVQQVLQRQQELMVKKTFAK